MAQIDHSRGSVRLLLVTRQTAEFPCLLNTAEANGWSVERADSGLQVLDKIQSGDTPDLVLLNLPRGENDCLHTLRWIRKVRPELPVVLLSDPDNNQQMLEAVRTGAQDYVFKPLDQEALESVIERNLSSPSNSTNESAHESIEALGDDLFFISASESTRKLRARAELLAQIDAPVLICGENGSGKELTARLIHKLSIRSGFRFAKVNCGAVPAEVLEIELFGCERAAANGNRAKPGKLEFCNGGTLFLDEIAEMPPHLQSRLLRGLQDQQIFRAGSDEPVQVDVRVIAASSLDAEKLHAQRKLREDLYYRLSAFTIQVPALRQRKEEIPVLLTQMLERMSKHYRMPVRPLSAAVARLCREHSWPGNLHELENFAKRYLVMGDESLPRESQSGDDVAFQEQAQGYRAHAVGSLKSLVRNAKGEAERNAISGALEETHWNRKAAARLLSISYRALLYKIQEYQIAPPEYITEFAGDFGARSRNQQ
jgi:DNA-binding NtrC family response regulator